MSSDSPNNATMGPVAEGNRITSLDLVRGVAVLGILLMNVVSFKLGEVPYWNISAGGTETGLDWAIAVFGEVFIDQKFMGMFSLLFGAGVMLFIDRAATRERRPVWLNLWRNGLLLAIGILHYQLWDGDVLTIYAIASLFLVALRRLPARALVALGTLVFLLPVPADVWAQFVVNNSDPDLSGIWINPDSEFESPLLIILLFGYFCRAAGMILIGAGLYRMGFVQGACSPRTYRLAAAIGLAVGLPLAAFGVIYQALNGFSPEVAFVGSIPNDVGTIPASLGYLSLVVLWNQRGGSWLKSRLTAVGRMALTNYLTQTILGILLLTVVLADVDITRTGLLVFVLAVWVVQVWWSQAWLNHFRFGPFEWLLRVGTYRRGQPMRRR